MNGDMPHVPITTLAGIASLTDCKCNNRTLEILKTNNCYTLLFILHTTRFLLLSMIVPVLNQLPLPSPLPATTAKSLLYNGRISEEVGTLLVSRDESLVTQLAQSLNQVSTEHM